MRRNSRLAGLIIAAALALAAHPAASDEQALSPTPGGKTYQVALFVEDDEIPLLDCWTFLPDGTFESNVFGTFGQWELVAAGDRAALWQASASIFNIAALETSGLTFRFGLRLAAQGTVQFGFGEPLPFQGFGFVNPFCRRG